MHQAISQHHKVQPAGSRGALARLSDAFPQSTPATVGVEIETLLVDQSTGQPVPSFEGVFNQLSPNVQQRTHGELFSFQIECATAPSKSLWEIRHQLEEFDHEVTLGAATLEAEQIWVGNHPDWDFDPKMIRDCERNQLIVGRLGKLVRSMTGCGLHLHAAVSRHNAIVVLDALQQFISLFVALSANSPLQGGQDTGRHSQRAQIWSTGFPVCGLCGPYGSWHEYDRHVEQLRLRGLIQSQKDLYYFTRLTRYGTCELRCCDLPPSIDHVMALAALYRSLVVWLQTSPKLPRLSRDILKAELSNAITHGPNAILTTHRGTRTTPLNWLAELQVDLASTAERLGDAAEVALADTVLQHSGSVQQLQNWQTS